MDGGSQQQGDRSLRRQVRRDKEHNTVCQERECKYRNAGGITMPSAAEITEH